MPGKLEKLRILLSFPLFRGARDSLVKIAWHIDPELSILQWTILDMVFSASRQNYFFSWMQYDVLYRRLKENLYSSSEWRQGPRKSYEIATGPLSALTFLAKANLTDCRVLDFGCGGHFSDSTGLILYLYGVRSVDCLEIGNTVSGFETGATLELVHWLQDSLVSDAGELVSGGFDLDMGRLDKLHKMAVKCKESNSLIDELPVHFVEGDLRNLNIENQSYDLVTSNAVLEHVDDPITICAELKRVLKIGGVMHHEIDFRDHRFFTMPDRYPPLPSFDKANWQDKNTNGWRFSDWLKLFNQDDLEIVKMIPKTVNGMPTELNKNNPVATCTFILRRVK